MDDFILTADNYYSLEADRRYMSCHQYFDFCGTLGYSGCEAKAMAKLRGEYTPDTTTAMLVGSYTDAWFDGTLDTFKKTHPECFTKNGALKAEYRRAEKMIERCQKDELFMQFMSGEKQKIFAAELFGCVWKCKLDSYIPGVAIVDLKTSADIHRAWRVGDLGYCNFIEYHSYTTQLAIYQRIVDICTGEKLPCYIAVVTKEYSPDIEIVQVTQMYLDDALNKVQMNMPSVLAVKNGDVEPIRCGHCDYCKATKKLMRPIRMDELIMTE